MTVVANCYLALNEKWKPTEIRSVQTYRLQKLNSRLSKGRELTEFEEMELEVKQKFQGGGKKREYLGEHTSISYVFKWQKQTIPTFAFTNMKIYLLGILLDAIKLLLYVTKRTQTSEIYQLACFFCLCLYIAVQVITSSV